MSPYMKLYDECHYWVSEKALKEPQRFPRCDEGYRLVVTVYARKAQANQNRRALLKIYGDALLIRAKKDGVWSIHPNNEAIN